MITNKTLHRIIYARAAGDHQAEAEARAAYEHALQQDARKEAAMAGVERVMAGLSFVFVLAVVLVLLAASKLHDLLLGL